MKGAYQIGDWVEVTATVTFDIVRHQRKPIRQVLRRPFTAQIVGATRRQLGTYYYGEDFAYLKCTGTVLVWLVRRGVTNRQIDVLSGDLVACLDNCALSESQHLPWRFATYPKIKE